jgi:hypothetical protein
MQGLSCQRVLTVSTLTTVVHRVPKYPGQGFPLAIHLPELPQRGYERALLTATTTLNSARVR